MKNLSILALAVALATSLSAPASAQSVSVVVNGQPLSFVEPPIVRAGRVFVPLRGVFERLGASVVYSSGQINATSRGRSISLTIGSTQATVDGQSAIIDVAPFIIGATTFVPLRFISQALGAAVNWNDSTSTVTIENAPAAPPPPRVSPVRFVTVAPTGTIFTNSPRLRFEFDRPVRIEVVRVSIDGRNVTAGLTQIAPSAFAIDLPWPIAPGPHRVRVSGSTEGGAAFELFWSFVRGG